MPISGECNFGGLLRSLVQWEGTYPSLVTFNINLDNGGRRLNTVETDDLNHKVTLGLQSTLMIGRPAADEGSTDRTRRSCGQQTNRMNSVKVHVAREAVDIGLVWLDSHSCAALTDHADPRA